MCYILYDYIETYRNYEAQIVCNLDRKLDKSGLSLQHEVHEQV